MLPLKKDKRFHQGYYKPKNKEKFIGEVAIFRSGLERKFFSFCDNNPNVVRWGSECVQILYFDSVQKKNRTYHVDNYVEIKEGNTTKKYLVEIKPLKQTQEPKGGKGKKNAHLLYETIQYKNNCDKWFFAKDFAKKKGMEFIIITEKDLN
jgi:hypothetical protein